MSLLNSYDGYTNTDLYALHLFLTIILITLINISAFYSKITISVTPASIVLVRLLAL